MKRFILTNSDRFTLISYGNGRAYCLINKRTNHDVYFQGDDASQFDDEMSAYQKAYPDDTDNQILARLWSDYSCVATPREDEAARMPCLN